MRFRPGRHELCPARTEDLEKDFVGLLDMAEQARFFDGKKFMWDGQEYESEQQAAPVAEKYENDGFEVETVSEDGKALLYSRRVVTEIVVE